MLTTQNQLTWLYYVLFYIFAPDCYHHIMEQIKKVLKKTPDGLNARIGDFHAPHDGDSHIRALLLIKSIIYDCHKRKW